MDFSKFKLGGVFPNSSLSISIARPKLKSVNISNFFSRLSFNNLKKVSPKKIALTAVLVAIIAAAILIALSQFGQSTTFQQNVVSEVPIGKTFQFPIRGENGATTGDVLTMNLTTAAKMKNILIQGKPATAREGKIFLIINLELNNEHPLKLNLAPVDLIRLVDASGKKFAPDVHNEAVAIEPISVKKTRVGFVVDEPSAGFTLQVGEINGSKETVSLAF